jgi:hypothetical protein
VHPQYIAVHLHSDVIHVIPAESGPVLQVALLDSNVIDMAFIGPTSCSCRLVYLSDSHTHSRVVRVLSLAPGCASFSEEFCADVPLDMHSLLPIQARMEASLILFTRDGIVRISAPQRVHPMITRFPVFLPGDGIILAHCHLRDDTYLMCDSCGGLTAGLFSTDVRPRTEFMRHIGPAAALVAVDECRFIVAAPFGDSRLYECRALENGFELAEVRRIAGSGPVVQMLRTPGGILCGTGKGESGSLRFLDNCIRCTPFVEISVLDCLSLFMGNFRELLYICMCFYNETRVVTFNGSELTRVECDFWESECTLDFTDVEVGILLITEHFVRIFNPETR